jgi:error-prone DNA polymerase
MRPTFAALNIISNFSFLKSGSHPEELVHEAARLNYSAVAVTDDCSVSGLVRAHVTAKECNIKLLIGAGFDVEFSTPQLPLFSRYIVLTQNREGYGNLCELITAARRRAQKGQYQLQLSDLIEFAPHCILIAIIDTNNVQLMPSIAAKTGNIEGMIQLLKNAFLSNMYLGYARNFGADDATQLALAQQCASHYKLPLVATPHINLATRERKPLLDALTAVRIKTTVENLGYHAAANAESHLKTIDRLHHEYPLSTALETTRIAALCNFSLDELRYEYPREVVPDNETTTSYLRKLSYEGLSIRYGNQHPEKVVAQVEHELKLIADLNYEAYFLTIYDVVKFARSRHILCQGRGSAANSAVCYCLLITEVDPARMQLLFERFISRERNEPPDIDVDFEHERREEVIQYLYQKYGRDRTALTAALSTYRPKRAIRDMGYALGLSLDQLDSLARNIAWWDGHTIAPERLAEAGFDPDNPHMQMLLALTRELIGFPRHLSQHSGGFVIARDKLTRLVPVENAAMAERTVIQWDKDDLDELGLLKVDVLALGMLTAIRKTLDLLNNYHGTSLRLQDIPAEDAATYKMIQAADTIGVFQIESRAQMSMLPRLKPENFYDLVIEVAIVRPGPIQGGMVHPYLKRRAGLEPVSYPSPAVEGVLKRTLGVSIFQEQVMQLAVVAAGFTHGEADKLRRAMAAWKRKGGIEPFRDQLLNGMQTRGYTLEYAMQIYSQMQGFGEYGFPESHAASFALLVYVSCWLKHHYPAAFTCGLLNAQPLGFYSPSALVQDVKRHDVAVLPIDIMMSDWDCALVSDADNGASSAPNKHHKKSINTAISSHPSIRLGLRMVKGLSADAAARITQARAQQAFTNIADVKRRAQLDDGAIQALAAADAFVNLTGHRRESLWVALGTGLDADLFHAPIDNKIEIAQAQLIAPTEAANVLADHITTGLSLRSHPVALLRAKFGKSARWDAQKIREARAGQLVHITGIVTCRQRPTTAHGTTFVTLEDETGYVNVIVWSRVAESQRKALVFSRLMQVSGVVEREQTVVHVVAGLLHDLTVLLGELTLASREFH